MIHSHLYARLQETGVFSIPAENTEPVCIVHKGDWLGVVNRQEGWVQVIGIECEGWVRANDVESRPPFQLHIMQSEGKSISYVSTPG